MAETSYVFQNLQSICRLCCSPNTLINIFDDRLEYKENMPEVIELTTGVKINRSDEISQMLCSKCLHLTIRMYKFRATSMINDMDLREKAAKQKKIHKSMVEIFRKYPKLIVPSSVVKQNVLPVVKVERKILCKKRMMEPSWDHCPNKILRMEGNPKQNGYQQQETNIQKQINKIQNSEEEKRQQNQKRKQEQLEKQGQDRKETEKQKEKQEQLQKEKEQQDQKEKQEFMQKQSEKRKQEFMQIQKQKLEMEKLKQFRKEREMRQKQKELEQKKKDEEKLEQVRREKEEHEFMQKQIEKREQEQKEMEKREQVRREKEKREQEQKEMVKQEELRREKEKREQEQKEREKEEQVRREKEKQQLIQKQKEKREQEQKEKEKLAQVRKEKEIQEIMQKQKEKLEQEQKEKERREEEQKEKEKQGRVRKEKEKQDLVLKQIEKEEQNRKDKEKLEKDQREKGKPEFIQKQREKEESARREIDQQKEGETRESIQNENHEPIEVEVIIQEQGQNQELKEQELYQKRKTKHELMKKNKKHKVNVDNTEQEEQLENPRPEPSRTEEEDLNSLFTVRSVSKTLLICDVCNTVSYTSKEFKKHRNTHKRCSLCRISFISMEKTLEHKEDCPVMKVMKSNPKIEIRRCEEIKDIREKYSDAFQSLIIEISDDEEENSCTTTEAVEESTDPGTSKTKDSEMTTNEPKTKPTSTKSRKKDIVKPEKPGSIGILENTSFGVVASAPGTTAGKKKANKCQTPVKQPFKPKLLISDADALQIDSNEDETACLKNLMKRISTEKVGKTVQTDVPCNGDISRSSQNGFLFELKNLRSFLNFTDIPVTMAHSKTLSLKYSYEPSALMKNQKKAQRTHVTPYHVTAESSLTSSKDSVMQTKTPKKSNGGNTGTQTKDNPRKTYQNKKFNQSPETVTSGSETHNSTATTTSSQVIEGNRNSSQFVVNEQNTANTMGICGQNVQSEGSQGNALNNLYCNGVIVPTLAGSNAISSNSSVPILGYTFSSPLQPHQQQLYLVKPNATPMVDSNTLFTCSSNTIQTGTSSTAIAAPSTQNVLPRPGGPPPMHPIPNLKILAKSRPLLLPKKNTMVQNIGPSITQANPNLVASSPSLQQVPGTALSRNSSSSTEKNPNQVLSTQMVPLGQVFGTSVPNSDSSTNTNVSSPQTPSLDPARGTSNPNNASSGHVFVQPLPPPKQAPASAVHVFKPPQVPPSNQGPKAPPPLKRIPKAFRKILIVPRTPQTNNNCDKTEMDKEQTPNGEPSPPKYIRVRRLSELK